MPAGGRARAPAGPRPGCALADDGPVRHRRRPRRRPGRRWPGSGWAAPCQQRGQAPIDGAAEAWQVGASVATLIRERRRGRAGRRAAGRDRDQRPGSGPAQRRPGPAGAQPGVARRLVRLDRARRAGPRRPDLARPTTPTSARSPSTSAGSGVGIDDLIYVSGNVGVGAGVITGGRRLEGAGGYAGEIGHLRFNPRGKPCHCGNRGCWETEVGAHAIAAAIRCPEDKVAAARRGPRRLHRADQGAAGDRRPPRPGPGQHRQRVQPADGRAGRLLPRALHAGRRRGERAASPSAPCRPPWSR